MRIKLLVLLVCLLITATAGWALSSLKVGAILTVTLESNPTTGYSWQLAKPLNARIIKLLDNKYYPARTDLVGSGGVEVWRFKGLKPGQAMISLKYCRPWEKNVAPVKVKILQVSIKQNS